MHESRDKNIEIVLISRALQLSVSNFCLYTLFSYLATREAIRSTDYQMW